MKWHSWIKGQYNVLKEKFQSMVFFFRYFKEKIISLSTYPLQISSTAKILGVQQLILYMKYSIFSEVQTKSQQFLGCWVLVKFVLSLQICTCCNIFNFSVEIQEEIECLYDFVPEVEQHFVVTNKIGEGLYEVDHTKIIIS